ncbi:MAG: 50S ribosomal protein L15 [Candidatus Moraniibacteriota bacterium]
MQIHQLKVAKRKKTKLIGRGGKRGKTSGRGSKGQGSRTGSSIDPLFEGGRSSLVERMKKLRGFKSPYAKPYTVTLERLERSFKDGEKVSREAFVEKKLFGKLVRRRGVKIVATGELTKKLILGGDVDASVGALEIIKKIGGTVEE